MNDVRIIGELRGLEELQVPQASRSNGGSAFAEALSNAVSEVDGLQKQSESAQAAFATGEDVDLHDVLIKIEEAEIAFRSMMEVRTKLIDAYREVMRIGGGG